MATSYDRRISFYINGKEITNDIRSIRAEMNKLVREQARMTIGSQEYLNHARQIRDLRGIIAEHNREVLNVSRAWSMARIGDAFNRYFSMIQAGTAAVVGLIFGFKALVKTFNDYEERLGYLSALTGLSGRSLEWLSQKAKELSQSTLESGIIVTQKAQDIVDAFTKVGSARPELLKNKEALLEVTQEAIILSNAAKIKLQPAIEGLTMVMNQYNVPADQARRIINALGAGSKEGAGEIPYLTTGFEKAGITAKLAGLSIETLIATLETLAPRFSQPEIAGRGLRGMLLKLQTGADDTNPAVVGMATALDNLGKKMLTPQKMLNMFGLENIAVAQTLITNVNELKKYEKAVSGTNVAVEQAAINTDNNNAKLAQAGNSINTISMKLGKELVPVMHLVTGYFGKFLKLMLIMIDGIKRYGTTIISATAAVVGYTIAVRISTIWTERNNAASIVAIALAKVKVMWHNTERSALMLLVAVQALMTLNLTRAAQAMRIFNAVVKLSPIGLLAGLITGVGTALLLYNKRLTDAEQGQKVLNDINKQAVRNISDEKTELEQLIRVAKNEALNKATRQGAIERINQISPEFLSNITLETIGTQQASTEINKYIENLERKARAQAAYEKLKEIEKEKVELETGEGEEPGTGTKIWHRIQRPFEAKRLDAISAAKKRQERLSELGIQLKAIQEMIDQDVKDQAIPLLSTNSQSGNEDKSNRDLIILKQQELEAARMMPGTTELEIAARNKRVEAIQKEITALNNLGIVSSQFGNQDKTAGNKTAMDEVEAENKSKIAEINSAYLHGKTDENGNQIPMNQEQYQHQLLIQEFEYLKRKKEILKEGSKAYEEVNAQILGKQVDAELTVRELILKGEKELADARIENLKDGIAKEKEVEKQRWEEEKSQLELRIRDHQQLSSKEIELNEIIHKIIEEKEKQHRKKMDALNSAVDIEQLEQKIEALEQINSQSASFDDSTRFLSVDLMKNYFKQREKLIQEQYEKERILAGENQEKLRASEEKYNNEMIHLKQNEVNATYEVSMRKIDIAKQFLDVLSSVADQETALGKAIFLFQQGLAIATIWISTAQANAKAVAELVLPPLWGPVVATNTAFAGAQTALVLAQTVAGFVNTSKSKKSKSKEYLEGGFTGIGDQDQVAGIVHKGEYVIPREGVTNPGLRPFIGMVELARKNHRLKNFDLNQMIIESIRKEYHNGGSTAEPISMPRATGKAGPLNSEKDLATAINELNKILKSGIKANAYINKYGRNGLNDSIDEITRFKSKVYKK